MQVTITKRTYIPENYQQQEANRVVEILIMKGDEVLDGARFPVKKTRECEKFVKELCRERGWEIV